MFDLNMGAGGLSPCLRLPKFLHQYGSKTITLADGTRQLVDQGTGKANGTLHSGHGAYFNGVDNTFTVNLVAGSFFYYKDGSFVHEEITTPEVRVISAGGIYKDLYNTPDVVFTANQLLQHQANPERTLYWQDDVLKSDILDQATIDSMQAGNGFWCPLSENASAGGYYRNHALPMPGNLLTSDFDVIQSEWTDNGDGSFTGISVGTPGSRELIEYGLLTVGSDYIIELEIYDYVSGQVNLYYGTGGKQIGSSNGVRRLKFTAGIDRLVPYGDNSFTGSIRNIKVYPLANSGLSELTNWQTTNATNAQALQYGTQSLLNPSDEFGLQSGVGKSGELYGDNRSYADTNDIRLDGDWCIDLYFNSNGIVANEYDEIFSLECFDETDTWLDDIRIYQNPDESLIKIERLGTYDSLGESVIVSIERVSGDLMFVINDGATSTVAKTFNHAKTKLIMSATSTYGESSSTLGTLQITEGTRTDEQRTKDVQKLANKHGVTI